MKKVLLFLLVAAMVLPVFGCGASNGKSGKDVEKEYSIQYADAAGMHTVTAKTGEVYSISPIPQKTGYVFLGLYDAEVGGTQYVGQDGLSLAPFADNKSMTLYPQFQAKEYTLVLDYGDAKVTDIRQTKVSYGAELPALPLSLTMDHMTFKGWFTKPNMEGVKVCDTYGLVPIVSIVNEKNFDLQQDHFYVYAGFESEKHTVTFYFDDTEFEEIKVPYGTPLSSVEYTTKLDGKAVLTWSKKKNDTAQEAVFKGKITDDVILYPVEWAPYIEFETNGGTKIDRIVKPAGQVVAFPETVKDGCVFSCWRTADGQVYQSYIMPEESTTLYAEWLVKMIFEENGGTQVADLARVPGSEINLPKTQKDGFLFAGWYTQDGRKYETNSMPGQSITLYAKYYKILTEEMRILLPEEQFDAYYNHKKPVIGDGSTKLDFSKFYNQGVRNLTVEIKYQSIANSSTSADPRTLHLDFFWADENDVSQTDETHLFLSFSEQHVDTAWHSYTFTKECELKSATAYMCRYYTGNNVAVYSSVYWKDMTLKITYPDMSNLY